MLMIGTTLPITHAQTDQDVFKLFWQKINDLVTPDWPAFKASQLPSQFFLMETPGFSVDSLSFDDDAWRSKGYDGSSPAYLTAQLVDAAPAWANYFVDSGYRISKLWAQFMLNAQTESPFDDPVRKARYEEAVSRLYTADFQPRPVQTTRETLLRAWEVSFDTAVDNRYQCLLRDNLPPDLCAQKAVIWSEELSAAWFAYETLNRDLMGTQSQILQMQANDLHLLLSQALEDFHTYERSEVGVANLFATYYAVSLTPSDWHLWFSSDPAVAAAASDPFVRVSVVSTESYTERETTYDRFFGNFTAGSQGAYDKDLLRVTSGTSAYAAGDFSLVGSAGGSSAVSFAFEIAKVKIERPWLDLGLLRYQPIAVTGLAAGEWSTGQISADVVFPLLPTAFIVARNIRVTSAGGWSSAMDAVMANVSDPSATDVSLQVGPFTAGANQNQYQRDAPVTGSASSYDGQTLTIPGPQIIGWVCAVVPYFPTANVADLGLGSPPATVVGNSTGVGNTTNTTGP